MTKTAASTGNKLGGLSMVSYLALSVPPLAYLSSSYLRASSYAGRLDRKLEAIVSLVSDLGTYRRASSSPQDQARRS